MSQEAKASLCVILGAAGWGCIGFFVNSLSAFGLTPLQIACARVVAAAVIFAVYLVAVNRRAFVIAPKDAIYFIGTGVISLSLFTLCNFNAIALSSMSVASVLLYTSPAFVLIMAAFFFKERITARKTAAVVCTFLGCVLVSGATESSEAAVPPLAVALGVGAGFAYALYSIFGRFALAKYKPDTVIAYTFFFSAAALLPMAGMNKAAAAFDNGYVWFLCIAFALVSTVFPYLLYTKGLQTMEAGKAAVLATMEPIVACIIGISIFHDPITPLKALGIMLIILSVLTLSVRSGK